MTDDEPTSFIDYWEAVDDALLKFFGIDTCDAGIDADLIAGAQEEWHAGPAPGIDLRLQRDKGLGHAARRHARLSQRQLARRLKVPPNWIQRIESLERRVDVAEFIAIARAVDVDPVSLLSRVLRSTP